MTNTRKMIHRVKDGMRKGSKLAHMNTPTGKVWFLVGGPAQPIRGRIADVIAELVIKEPDVFPSNDGLFGSTQTYSIG